MEESMASLAICPSRDAFDEFEPFDIDTDMTKFYELVEKLKSFDNFPFTIPERRIPIPGSDSFRLSTEQRCHDEMAEYYPRALGYFNNKYNTDYKYEAYVDLILAGMDDNYATHCNFTAKPQSAPFKPGDFSTKLFFAEFMPTNSGSPSLTFCSILDGADDAEAFGEDCCSMCPKGTISHPTSFKSGCKSSLE